MPFVVSFLFVLNSRLICLWRTQAKPRFLGQKIHFCQEIHENGLFSLCIYIYPLIKMPYLHMISSYFLWWCSSWVFFDVCTSWLILCVLDCPLHKRSLLVLQYLVCETSRGQKRLTWFWLHLLLFWLKDGLHGLLLEQEQD